VQANAVTANDRSSWLIDGTWLAGDIGGAGVIDDAQSTLAFAASAGVNGSAAAIATERRPKSRVR
jgi:hypothetical protein